MTKFALRDKNGYSYDSKKHTAAVFLIVMFQNRCNTCLIIWTQPKNYPYLFEIGS